MKEIIAFNGSPRREWNTATMLKKALEGAASLGAKTELINLYDLQYKGCVSCFACKENNGKSYGRCAINDVLAPIFKKIEKANAIVLGSPIYFGSSTGEMQSFLERLLFAYLTYTNPPTSLFPNKIRTGIIYTMGIPEDMMSSLGYQARFTNIEQHLALIFGSSETLLSFDTLQFSDYSKVFAPRFSAKEKLQRHQQVFPVDCQKAFEMGMRLVQDI